MFAILILPICLLVAVNAAGVEFGSVLEQQHGSMRMLLDVYGNRRARAVPSTAAVDQCFGNYMTDEAAVISVYNKAFTACSNVSESAKRELQEEHLQYREDLLKRGDAICIQMDACKDPTDVLEFFNCYHAAASSNTESLYGITMDSEGHSTNLQTKYAQLENKYKVCVSSAHNQYLNDIFATNKALQGCLGGQSSIVPTIKPSATTHVPTTTTLDPLFEEDILNR